MENLSQNINQAGLINMVLVAGICIAIYHYAIRPMVEK